MAGEFPIVKMVFRFVAGVAAGYAFVELITGGVTKQLMGVALFCFLLVYIVVELGWGGQFGEWWRPKTFHYWTHKRSRARRKRG